MKQYEKKAYKKAQELGSSSTEEDIQKIDSEIGKMKKGLIAKIWDKVLFLWESIKSPEVPLSLKITVVGALLYLILPVEVIPDYIPGIGFIDDFSVLMLVFTEVTKFVLPKISKKPEVRVQESYYKEINSTLRKNFKFLLVNIIITFVANMTGVVVIQVKSAGEYSKYIAAGIFTVTFIYSLVMILIFLLYKKYGKIVMAIIKKSIKNKSVSDGVSCVVNEKYPAITEIYAGINIEKTFDPETDEIPDYEKIVKDFRNYFMKTIILLSAFLGLYVVIILVQKLFFSV